MTNEQTLPDDVHALKALVWTLVVEVDRLKIQLAQLRRSRFGRSSEQLAAEILQLELALDALTGSASVDPGPSLSSPPPPQPSIKSARRPLPAHLARESVVHAPVCRCPACGGELRELGEDVAEMLAIVRKRPGMSPCPT